MSHHGIILQASLKYYKDLIFLYGISFIGSARGKLVDYSLY